MPDDSRDRPSASSRARFDPTRVRFALRVHYDGAPFFGWQLQPGVPTVQGELETVLSRLTGGERVVVTGSGRTDRGVHATGQVAVADLPASWTAGALRRSLNALLPRGIWIEAACPVSSGFHPRFDAVRRSYRYRVGTVPETRSPFLAGVCWTRCDPPPDLEVLEQCAEGLPGTRSFRAFAKAGQPERGEICTIFAARWRPWGTRGLVFEVQADRFLHHMVRYLVGTMVEVAEGGRPMGEFEALLKDPNAPFRTSPPAPPEGLFLVDVEYPHDAFKDAWSAAKTSDAPASHSPHPTLWGPNEDFP